MNKPWVYKVTVPAGRSDAFIIAMLSVNMLDDDVLEVLEEGD
jgi:hypothetical protein